MPKNVMKLLKPSPNYGRNDFDLSHRHLFTANFGELIPGTCIETVPNDKIILRISDLVRAQPMVTSPYLRAKQHCDLWFVPYNLMWSKFNEFIVDKDEPASSVLNNRLYLPHTDLDSIASVIQSYHGMTYKDIHGYNCTKQVCRNLDLLGIPGSLLHAATLGDAQYVNKKINLWRLLAYNLIWYREYRQQYYDDGKYLLPSSLASNVNGAAFLFNVDFLTCNTINNSFVTSGDPDLKALLSAIIQPRYRLWKKDLFTGLLPSTQFGAVSLVDINDNLSILDGFTLKSKNTDTNDHNLYLNNRVVAADTAVLTGASPLTPRTFDFYVSGNPYYPLTLDPSRGNVNLNYDILALRKSEAIQKWRENALRAGNQVQDNFEAHYGVKPRSHMDVHPQHIASFDAPLNIGDVMSTADTGVGLNGVVGDVAGKGIMSFSGNEAIKFETNDFGVIMAIYSILPEAEYNSNGIDRLNSLLEREDYFFNEYENLGLEAVDKSVITDLTNVDLVMGYAPRYFAYKQKLDRVCGEFQMFQGYSGQFAPWVAPKFDVDDVVNNPVPLSTLYVNPSVFDNNFHYNYRTVDQFLVDFYCDVEAIRQMSVSGMPGF